MNKEMHVYKMEFCSARKKMKPLFVGKWMKQEHHARKSKPYAESPLKHTHTNMYSRNFISQNFSYRDRYMREQNYIYKRLLFATSFIIYQNGKL